MRARAALAWAPVLAAVCLVLRPDAVWAADVYVVDANSIDWTESEPSVLSLALTSADSLDGDGYADLVVGEPEVDAGLGRTLVCPGHPPPWNRGLDVARCGLRIHGLDAGGQFGSAVATLDFDGDGFFDLAVGAPNATGFVGQFHGGRIYIFRGGPGTILDVATFPIGDIDVSAAGWVLYGELGDRIGEVLVNAGRFDNRPGDELAIGAPTSALGGSPPTGAVWVVSQPAGRDSEVRRNAVLRVWGRHPNGRTGAALASVGDLNGDGYSDLWIGAPSDDRVDAAGLRLVQAAGRVILIHGGPGGPGGRGPSRIDLEAVAIIQGERLDAEFGAALAVIQIDAAAGPRPDDLLVGEPGADSGRLFLLRGRSSWPGYDSSSDADLVLNGSRVGSGYGSLLATADAYRKGSQAPPTLPDHGSAVFIAASAYPPDGRVYVVPGYALRFLMRAGVHEEQVDNAAAEIILGVPSRRFLRSAGGARHGDMLGLGFATPVLVDSDDVGSVYHLTLLSTEDSEAGGGDGCMDAIDPFPLVLDVDADLNGIPDVCEQCVGDNAQGDFDNDLLCDNLDPDIDNDGCLNALDDAPRVVGADLDRDGQADVCDSCFGVGADLDSDGLCDDLDPDEDADGCPTWDPMHQDPSPRTADTDNSDGDRWPDVCDLCVGDDDSGDGDGDGTCDDRDACNGPPGGADLDLDQWCEDDDLTDALIWDCDDRNAAINPGATDTPNNQFDENCDLSDGVDVDQDGYLSDIDCNDASDQVFPGAAERCDRIDNDCDGRIDEEFDDDRDGAVRQDPLCQGTYSAREFDCVDTRASINPEADEICDGFDNDCDGLVPQDERDADGDTVRICQGDCDDTNPAVQPRRPEDCTNKVDDNCDGNIDLRQDLDADGVDTCDNDCDDTNPLVNPDQVESCNRLDDDCTCLLNSNGDEFLCGPGDLGVDEDFDLDHDGWVDGSDAECAMAYNGFLTDCQDGQPNIHPFAREICLDGLDNDCLDGDVTTAQDLDQDQSDLCYGDCNDRSVLIGLRRPGISGEFPELCDGLDNDCDGTIDEGLDGDGDGLSGCRGDCDDTDVRVGLQAEEICDGRDNNCNCSRLSGDSNGDSEICSFSDLGVDEGFDADRDDYVTGADEADCYAGLSDAPELDCDDTDVNRFPHSPELCDAIDQDCDGDPTNGFDIDGDGQSTCEGDCGDGDRRIGLDFEEDCADGLDNDCDTLVDVADRHCKVYSVPRGFFCAATGPISAGPGWAFGLLGLAVIARRRGVGLGWGPTTAR